MKARCGASPCEVFNDMRSTYSFGSSAKGADTRLLTYRIACGTGSGDLEQECDGRVTLSRFE